MNAVGVYLRKYGNLVPNRHFEKYPESPESAGTRLIPKSLGSSTSIFGVFGKFRMFWLEEFERSFFIFNSYSFTTNYFCLLLCQGKMEYFKSELMASINYGRLKHQRGSHQKKCSTLRLLRKTELLNRL